MPNKLVTVSAPVIKSDELPDDIAKADDGKPGLWAYASVEVSDREQDIVRVDGISLKNHTDATPIPIIASHDKKIGVDGYPMVGKAVQFLRTTHKATGAPALAFKTEFADSPFGKVMEKLYEQRVLSKFSIGFLPDHNKAKQIKGGGYDYVASELMEISACVIPMNPLATVMREMGIEQDETEQLVKAISEKLDAKIEAFLTKLDKRLDDFESAVVTKSKHSEATGGTDSDAVEQIDYAPLLAALDAVKSHLTPRK